MRERKTLFHHYVKYETMPERRYLRQWVRAVLTMGAYSVTTAALVLLGISVWGIG